MLNEKKGRTGRSKGKRSNIKRAAGKSANTSNTVTARTSASDVDSKYRTEFARRVALSIAEVGLEKKVLNVEIIDVRGKVDYSDYIVVMSGRSERQVMAISGYIQEHLQRVHGVRCMGLEGVNLGSWVLMDYSDVIVHIFHEDTRGYYDLESLWIDAARIAMDHI